MKLHSLFVSVLTAGLLVGCGTTPPFPKPLGEGFVAFESPRDFDGPGQVYRVDPKTHAVYHVGEIKVAPKSGTEQTKAMSTTANWSFATALKYTGVSLGGLSPEAKAQFSHERSVSIESTSVTRQYLEDTDNPEKKVTELLGTVKYRPDNKYYLIRETAATKEINVKGSRKSLGNAKVQAELQSVISGNAELKYDSESSFSLVAKFPKDMRVWYKPERLEPQMAMGAAAPGSAGAKAVPAFTPAPVKPGELSLPKGRATTKP